MTVDGSRESTPTRPPVPRQRPGDTVPATNANPAGSSGPRGGTGTARLTDVLPVPVLTEPAAGVAYPLTAEAAIRTTAQPAATAVGDYLAELLRPATGYPLPVSAIDPTTAGPTAETDAGIWLLLADTEPTAASVTRPEGYELEVTATRVVIRAATGAGLFYGVQTLRQLLPPAIENGAVRPGPWHIPGGRIVDHPRYGYRGAMLDVARHFFPVADVLRFVDHLARYKLNHLHLHLTDDQGWRIAIDSWPRLASVGGATEVGGGPGGYYTREQYGEIVDYAAARHITVVPEIDLPGHTNAALTAYGELAPDGVTPPPYTGTDVGFSSLAVRSERTYQFIDDVLGEVAALTPGPYLHIGGDEAFTLSGGDYAAFMNRVQPIVAAKGKTVLGWHQLAAAEHVPGRIIQYWGTATADAGVAEAVRQGARVIMSPGNRTYLDMKYTEATPLGKDWAGLVEVHTAYDWDPGSYLDGVPAEAVLGVAAPLWTETITSMSEAEFMIFPRLPAIAELGWSPRSTHDWPAFRDRLAAQEPRWSTAGITFHRSPQVPWAGAPVGALTGAPDAPVSAPAVPKPRSGAHEPVTDQP